MSTERRKTVAGRRLSAAVLAPGAIALALMVTATPSSAATRTFLGQTHENFYCISSDQWIQTTSTGPSFVVPTGDTTLTRWSTNGGIAAGTMQFEVWAPAGGNDYTLVYISAPTTLQAGTITHVAVTPAVEVVAGDIIGYRAVTDADCALRTNRSADAYLYDPGSGTPTVGSTVGFQGPATGFRFNIGAVVR
jgi:hypothetical protein